MLKYASNMEFEKAAELRDKIKELENMNVQELIMNFPKNWKKQKKIQM